MKKCYVLTPFHDVLEGITRKAGDTFIASDERGAQLEKLGIVMAVHFEKLEESEESVEEPVEEVKEVKTYKRK